MAKNVTRVREPGPLLITTLILSPLCYFANNNVIHSQETAAFKTTLVGVTSLFLVVLWIALYAAIKNKLWLRKRQKKLQFYTYGQGIPVQLPIPASYLSHTLFSMGKRDNRFDHCYGDEQLRYGEYSYAVYQKTKYGEYKSSVYLFAVCIARLPRVLPNLFFDAKATEGWQYKRQFDPSQKHSLEGDFDSYFDTYFPTHYQLDSLSFITPEVMQAMIAAHNYDIEIVGNSLYLYAPLRAMPDQIQDMFAHGEALRKVLLNNITTYRDQRVEYGVGRKTISEVGMRLRKNITYSYYAVLLSIFGLFASVIVLGSNRKFKTQIILASLIFGGYHLFIIMNERKERNRLKKTQ